MPPFCPLVVDPATNKVRRGEGIHLTPTKRRRMNGKQVTTYAYQGLCTVCRQRKSTYLCLACIDDATVQHRVYVCAPQGNRPCFSTHVLRKHS
jgi:hypothetical protein